MTKRLLLLTSLIASLSLLQGCSDILSATKSDPIESNPGKRSFGSLVDDEIIETKTQVNIDKADPQLAQSHIVVTSYNGIVLLAGQVNTASLRQLAAQTASKVNKVRRVHNEITISGPTSTLARSNDSWITTKLKSKMLADSEIAGRRIKVVTENGVVFLMGLLSHEEGDRAAEMARQTHGVQKVVRIFEYI